jgi:hypothetical protein
MLRVLIGRTLAVVVAAVVPAVTGAAAAQAQQADPPQLKLVVPGVSIPVGDAGTPILPRITTTATVAINAGTVTYELDGVGGLSVPAASGCQQRSANKIVCAVRSTYVHVDSPVELPGVIAKAAEASTSTGDLTVTFEVAGGPTLTAGSRVRTATTVDLAAGPPSSGSVAAGQTVDVPLQVRNQGDGVAHGAAVVFSYYSPFQFKAAKTFSNCSYAGGSPVSCRFGQDLAAGRTYRAELPYQVRADALVPSPGYQDFQLLWLTPAELADHGNPGTPGTGTELTLDELAETLADPQADEDKSNNATYVDMAVTGEKNGVDFKAIGDKVTGKKGDVVKATVGFRNVGPASYNAWDVVQSVFQVPPGTSVVRDIPRGCLSQDEDGNWQPDQPGKPLYSCTVDAVIPVGGQTTFDFNLRIDKVIPNAKGSFLAGGGPCERECPIFQGDVNLTNQEAAVIVNPKAKPPAGNDNDNANNNDNGNPGGNAGSDTSGGGGGLPVTGPASGLIAVTGALLIAGGSVLLLIGRRRVRSSTGI